MTIPTDSTLYRQLERVCERAPDVLERADEVSERLNADASTPGSLAHLKERIAEAEKNGNDRVVFRLEQRLERREELAAKLPERIEKLKDAAAECGEYGIGKSE